MACLERVLKLDGSYGWQPAGPAESASSAEIADFLAKRTRFDEDIWAIELDIADPERFIAETRVDIPESSVSDAVMLMDLRNTPALMFKNSATGAFNMIYRREDGNIGWVEPHPG